MTKKIKYIVDQFQGTGSIKLHYHQWTVEDPKAALVIVHGYSEHAARYDHIAQYYVRKGVNVYSYDQRGHGLSPGRRGHIKTFDDYVSDLRLFITLVRGKINSTFPIYLLGHSMGGLISTIYISKFKEDALIHSTVLTSPCYAVAISSPLLETIARIIRPFVPTLKLPNKIIPHYLTHDRKRVEESMSDPLIFRTATINWYFALLSAQENLFKTFNGHHRPIYILQAGDDRVVDANVSKKLFDQLEMSNKKFELLENLYHEVLNEPNYIETLERIYEWQTK